MLKRLFAFLCTILVAASVSAEPEPRPGIICQNEYVMWIHDNGIKTTTLQNGVPEHIQGKITADHREQTSSVAASACFTHDDVREHHVRYICETAFWRITARTNGTISAAPHDIKIAIGTRADSGAITVIDVISSSPQFMTVHIANGIVNHNLDFIHLLVKNRFYALVGQTNAGGTPTHKNQDGDFWQFEEMKCANVLSL